MKLKLPLDSFTKKCRRTIADLVMFFLLLYIRTVGGPRIQERAVFQKTNLDSVYVCIFVAYQKRFHLHGFEIF